MIKTYHIILFCFAIYFFVWFGVYKTGVNTFVIQSEDTVPTIFLPLAILKQHTLNLDNYVPMMIDRYPHPDDRDHALGLTPFYLKKVGDHYLSAFPVLTAVMALPVYAVALLFSVSATWQNLAILAHVSSACIVSLSCGAFYILLKNKLKLSYIKSVVLTATYAFGTINFALVSQGLWQHGTVQLFGILALISFIDFIEFRMPGSLVFFSLFTMLAFLSRPTFALVAIVFGIYILSQRNWIKNLIYLSIGAILPVLFFIWYNATYYLTISNQGYSSQLFKNWLGGFPLSFLGVWLSPSKGILIYSPVILFAILGIRHLTSKSRLPGKYDIFYKLAFCVVMLHTLIISFWKHWFGGWSFGYRMSADVIPFMVLLIVPWYEVVRSKKLLTSFYVSLIASIIIELSGLVFFDGFWHATYDTGYKNTQWLWSLKNSEVMYNYRRVLVKLNMLKSPN